MKPGEALAEVIATAHNGRNVGKTPLKLSRVLRRLVG